MFSSRYTPNFVNFSDRTLLSEESNLSASLDGKLAAPTAKSQGSLIALALVKELTSDPYVALKKLKEPSIVHKIISYGAELFVINYAQESFLEFASKAER